MITKDAYRTLLAAHRHSMDVWTRAMEGERVTLSDLTALSRMLEEVIHSAHDDPDELITPDTMSGPNDPEIYIV